MTRYLTDLSKVVQRAGLVVHEVSGWETRGHGGFVAVTGIVEHHTAGPKTGLMPSLGTLVRGRPGLAGPLCNIGLARDGSVYVVAAGVAWHAGVGSGHFPTNLANHYAIGIEAESSGKGDWTPAQLAAWPKLNAVLAAAYGFPVAQIIGHYEWTTRKIDPYGLPGRMPGLRTSTTTAARRPTPPKGNDDMTSTTVKGLTDTPTQLVAGQWRTAALNNSATPGKPYVSAVAGPGRVEGPISLYLAEAAAAVILVEAYLVRKNPAGAFEYVTGNGLQSFAPGESRLRYVVGMDVPAGYYLRARVFVGSEDDTPPAIVRAGFNLTVRS